MCKYIMEIGGVARNDSPQLTSEVHLHSGLAPVLASTTSFSFLDNYQQFNVMLNYSSHAVCSGYHGPNIIIHSLLILLIPPLPPPLFQPQLW